MPSHDGLHHPRRADGSDVDATFELQSSRIFQLTYHHKAGRRGSPRSVNADYHEGLELLLARLAELGTSIFEIVVDSSIAQRLPLADRELALDYPIELDATTDAALLRRTITAAQKPVARRPNAQAGGGNDQKRIRITFSCDQHLDDPGLLRILTGLRADSGHLPPSISRGSSRRREGRTPQDAFYVPILKTLQELGGSGSTHHVVDVVGKRMGSRLTDADLLALPSSGELRWRNTARWARRTLVELGYLDASSPRGIWRITTAGVRHLEPLEPRANQ